ncbi:oxygen-independent coproporphyrinogen III oxidase [Sphingomonas sp. MMS12-HWE2-04]|uniref:oxygen-independent coproporphyrinogen III oxidase n=1 Tax=Sphingomonas sp. MMS12-HWE2-04 TaxID=3234199 RepID=UPI00384EF4F9
MWTYHPDLLARAVPRYTSYPTAAEFGDAVSGDDMARALDLVGLEAPISLYLHIPYCREICWYCGCNTGAANRMTRLTAYLERLHEEIDLVADRLGGRGRVGRIAFGGGSPNAIAPTAFAKLVEHVVTRFRCADSVLSVEIDPRGFDSAWARVLRDTGTSRVSLGVQTFDAEIQAAIGRVQPESDIRRTVALLREAGVDLVNFDLMYGLPGQDETSLAATLGTALTMAPDRFSVFGYAHVPAVIPRQKRIDASALPDAEARFGQAELAHGVLRGAGYRAIGFDHFALPGDALARAAANGSLRRNFQGFTEDPAETLIGLGASAISAFPDRLLQNEKNTGRYHLAVGAGRFATARGLHRSGEDRLRGRAIEAILAMGGADLSGFAHAPALRERLRPFEARQLVSWQGDRLVLAEAARPYARAIAATLDAYRGAGSAQFSNAV